MRALTILLLALFGTPLLTAEPPGRDDFAYDRPVVITARHSNCLDLEWQWIVKHYPGAKIAAGQPDISIDLSGRGHDAVSFTTAQGQPKTVHFYITFVK